MHAPEEQEIEQQEEVMVDSTLPPPQPQVLICKYEDLNKHLDEDLKKKFKGLFYDKDGKQLPIAWRMFYDGTTPDEFLSGLGIDIDNPRVRDAVAFDLVKLDDGSVSNDWNCEYEKHLGYSPSEYERMLLHRNFRINLVHTEPQFTKIRYNSGDEPQKNDTVDFMYQGIRLSTTFLDYFQKVIQNPSGWKKISVPITNQNDITFEVALIPNTHPDFRPATSRAYYDRKYIQYKKLLKEKYGIQNISTFALVDQNKDKNHTGWFRVKVQFGIPDGDDKYHYLVATIDKNGQLAKDKDGFPDIVMFKSKDNLILSVCENDFDSSREDKKETWDKDEQILGPIPMVKSTTSSHYSVFAQRIPDYDLKYVRNYLQFKTRLEGMELCLDGLNRDMHSKEVQSSECFSNMVLAIQELFKELIDNKDQIDLIVRFYELLAQYDKIYMELSQLKDVIDNKKIVIDNLTKEYNELNSKQLDKKIELGRRIRSLKLEMGINLKNNLDALTGKIRKIKDELAEVKSQMHLDDDKIDRIKRLIQNTERWRNFMYNLGYEFQQMSEMKTICDDNTIKVKRLVHNFKEKMERVENEVWDENHQMKDHALDNIASASLQEVILLNDWYACNAPEKTPQEMGFDDEDQFKLFRKKCNKVALSLRKNQYAQILAEKNVRIQEKIDDLQNQILNSDNLEYEDIYGGTTDKSKNQWSLDNVVNKQVLKLLGAYGKADKELGTKQYVIEGFKSKDDKLKDSLKIYNDADNELSKSVNWNIVNFKSNRQNNLDVYNKADAIVEQIEKLSDCVKNFKSSSNFSRNDFSIYNKVDDILEQIEVLNNNVKNFKSNMSNNFNIYNEVDDIIEQIEKLNNRIKNFKSNKSNNLNVYNEVNNIVEQIEKLSDYVKNFKSNNKSLDIYAITEKELEEDDNLRVIYEHDTKELKTRTIGYLKKVGLIEKESDIEKLIVVNRSQNYNGDLNSELKKVEEAKESLDFNKTQMLNYRKTLQRILNELSDSEKRVNELKSQNSKILNQCVLEKNKQIRNRLLLKKLENENKIVELKGIIKSTNDRHFSDLSKLKKMKETVDKLQKNYDNSILTFKNKVGVSEEALENLMVGIYNKWKDEILNGEVK